MEKRLMLEPNHETLSIRRQCQLLELNRSSAYYEPATESPLNLELMELMDKKYTARPFYGSRRMLQYLRQDEGYKVNRKRVQRLMRLMGIQGVAPGQKKKKSGAEHKIYPYLLEGVTIEDRDQVWSTDITYIPISGGFMYLVAVIDWFSRYVLSWKLSNTMDVSFCTEALEESFELGRRPEIFNTDQGSQFTSHEFTGRLKDEGVLISMDGKGRCFDNIFVERLWRTVKYEDIYLKDYENGIALHRGLDEYFWFYNYERRHQSLDYRTPGEVYHG